MAARTWSGSTGATLDTGVATASATLERHPVAADLPSATGSMLPRLLSKASAAVGYPVAAGRNLIWLAQQLPSSTTARRPRIWVVARRRRRRLVRGPLDKSTWS